jgi:DnaJ family protein C protein 19
MIATRRASNLLRGAAVRRRTKTLAKATAATTRHFGFGDDDDDDEASRYLSTTAIQLPAHITDRRREYHTTAVTERGVAIVMGLATVSALGFAGSSAIKSYNEWKAAQPTEEELEEMRKQEERAKAKDQAPPKQEAATDDSDKPRRNVFREWFDVGTKYYEGGFEDTMTRREAALILGVRESSSPARVKDAHRKLLILNHPDTGGSTYIAGKVNEAKELLLKGKSTRKK